MRFLVNLLVDAVVGLEISRGNLRRENTRKYRAVGGNVVPEVTAR